MREPAGGLEYGLLCGVSAVAKKKCVYITGGSSGIGLGLARFYASAGDDVILLARDREKLAGAVSDCRQVAANSEQIIAGESLDITAYPGLPTAVDELVGRHGLPDLVLLCAGVAGNKRFLDCSAAEFDLMMDINLAGSREVVRALLPAMLQRDSGQLAFVSSMAGLVGMYGYSAYSASKFAVNGLAQSLQQELAGTGVSVHVICPPEVNTPMIAAETAQAVPQTRFLKDLVGTLEPDEAARKIAAGLDRRRLVIIPGFRARLVAWSARHFPAIFSKSIALLLRWKF
jgi:3-dehydrosphinganine reductase